MALLERTATAQEFPIFSREGLVYLDSAATSQKPRQVIEAVDAFYAEHNANVHRAVYPLAIEADELYDGARAKVAAFCGAAPEETIFTSNATSAINLVSHAWGQANVGEGDEIVLTVAEHHANIVPWQLLCERTGAQLRWLDVDAEGRISLDQLDGFLSSGRVRLVTVTHLSNVLGTINPVAEIIERARAAGATTLIDGSQAVPQIAVDFAALGADFYAWTGHKAYGPTGVGVLHGRLELLEQMPPFMGGGGMIASVSRDGATWAPVPEKFEAGTPPIAEAVGLSVAMDFLSGLGMEAVRSHERELTAYMLERLDAIPGLAVSGPPEAAERGALASFTLDCAHPHDVAEILAREQVSVRAGHHCTQPLMDVMGQPATTRASLGLYNTPEDIDALIEGLGRVIEIFGDD
ncbi:MAG: SufS family cysteine desulfurase [Solirubrobacteraceae bacterium]|nr:SufS family cysteine desulfurase [Solirubrobacteraceae bacterium]